MQRLVRLIVLALAMSARIGFADDPKLDAPQQKEAPTAFAAKEPRPVMEWGIGDGKSYLVPAYEIPAFELLLNRYDHYALDSRVYASPISNFKENIHRKWVVDNDAFATNQFLHPYQGAIYQGLARSSGLGFWESSGYTLAGSLLWEEAGETTRPSINDQVASGIAGNFLGEPLFRMASLLLESGPNGEPGLFRKIGAAVISPSMGLNRLVYGNRFAGVFRSNDPAVFTRVDLGASLSTQFTSNVNVNADLAAPPASQTFKRQSASAIFTMAYGLPGKPDYDYDRPFDYFNFELGADTNNALETVFSRGLLYGTDYEVGPSYRGIWGLYGTYDYVAPQIFRVSTTAASIGTTGQWWLSRHVAVQGTALAGVGYGGGGVIHGAGVARAGALGDGQRDYHYGMTPQVELAVRLILGDRVSLDTTAREYYISRVAATESTGSENITRADTALTIRVYNLHGITLRYSQSTRNGRYASLPTSHQTVGTFSIGYTLVGQTRFGAVDWRPASQGGP
ncbi:MAG TPA: DUF3943 domain-containing protein [Steroidobacteraceae bacterium]